MHLCWHLPSRPQCRADEGAAPVKVIVEIQDANGDSAAADSDIEVTFETSSKTGTFAETATGAGEAELPITIKQGADSMTVWYSDFSCRHNRKNHSLRRRR